MKEEYDFSKAEKNPFAERIRKEGYTIRIRYTPEYLAELRNNPPEDENIVAIKRAEREILEVTAV